MDWWQILLLAIVIALAVLVVAAFVLWRTASAKVKVLGERVNRLPWRLRVKLVWRLTLDDRVPLSVRAIPPLLMLYLITPIDLVPDFIPVVGQLDDILVLVVALGLLVRFVPLDVVDTHLTTLESDVYREQHPV